MLLFTSLYFSDPSGSNLFFLSSHLLSHRSRISAVIQGFFFWQCLPRISLAVSVTAVLKVVIIESVSVSSLLMMVRGANLPPITAWKTSKLETSFISFPNLELSTLWHYKTSFISFSNLELSSSWPYKTSFISFPNLELLTLWHYKTSFISFPNLELSSSWPYKTSFISFSLPLTL